MTALLFIVGILLAAAFQARLPTLWWLGGVRLEFVPALVVYGSLTLPRRQAILLAIMAGMAQDALSASPFGLSVLAYGLSALWISGARETLDRDLPWVQMGAGGFTSATVAVIAFFVVGVSFAMLFKFVVVVTISGIITVVLFFALDYARAVWGDA